MDPGAVALRKDKVGIQRSRNRFADANFLMKFLLFPTLITANVDVDSEVTAALIYKNVKHQSERVEWTSTPSES